MKKLFKSMNDRIRPADGLPDQVMEQTTAGNRWANFRPIAAVAAVLVLVFMATPVLAEHIPWILERIAPELTKEYVSVEFSDTDNGITMEVTAASIHGNVAGLVVKIEGEALVEPVGVAPFIEVNGARPTKTTISSLLDYEGAEADRAKGIYYYQVEITYSGGTTWEEILGDEMTIVLSEVRISGFASEEAVEVPIIFTDYEQITVERDRAMEDYGFCSFGTGYSEGYEYYADMTEYVLMTPGESVYDVTDELSLTGAAYIDGKLHIQMAAWDMNGGEPEWSYGVPYLVDSYGNWVTSIYRNLFALNEGGDRVDYEECIYDIPQERLENYKLMVNLKYHSTIDSNCQVTFRFSEDDVVKE